MYEREKSGRCRRIAEHGRRDGTRNDREAKNMKQKSEGRRNTENKFECQSGKGKVFPYSLPSVGPGADPGVQAVSPQVT